jgi:hypothetical protein
MVRWDWHFTEILIKRRALRAGLCLVHITLLLFILDQRTPVPKPVMQITAKRGYLAYALGYAVNRRLYHGKRT